MQFQTPRSLGGAALALALSVGCGDLADQDSRPPALTTFQGSLHLGSSVAAPEGSIRLALIWSVPDQEDPYEACYALVPDNIRHMAGIPASSIDNRLLLGSVQQAVEIIPRFPSAFKLEITAPPPPEAMREQDGGVQMAEGKLVVYLDGNSNGKLDPRTDSAASPDQVLSAERGPLEFQSDDSRSTTRPWAYGVVYLDRPPELGVPLDLKSGYNVLAYREYGSKPTTEIDLELLPTPALQTQLCSEECVLVDSTPFACPENPATDLPQVPATALSGYSQNGKAWIWADGPDSFVYEDRHCVKHDGKYTFSWTRTYANGCLRRHIDECDYGPAPEPPSNWPCETYVEH